MAYDSDIVGLTDRKRFPSAFEVFHTWMAALNINDSDRTSIYRLVYARTFGDGRLSLSVESSIYLPLDLSSNALNQSRPTQTKIQRLERIAGSSGTLPTTS